jgi:ribosomal protein S18 acetylase RimI-like enzyme
VIRGIALRTWPSAYGDILSPSALQYMLDFFYSEAALSQQMAEGQQFFLATLNNEVIGFGSVSKATEDVFKLNKLYVLPGIQKTGAGKALMDHAFAIARSNKAIQLTLNVNRNNPAIGFYTRLGFSIVGEEDVDLGNGVVQEDYIMSVEL